MQPGCAICFDSFNVSYWKNSDRIIATRCGHVFHNSCMQKWLKRSSTCPECRRYVRKERLSKLFINFCMDSRFNIEEESLESVTLQLCTKDLECFQKDQVITELLINYGASERKIEEKDQKIKELQTSLDNFKQEILEKDEKIKELQTLFVHSELESIAKDGRIEELQMCFARSELQCLEKDQKIKELQTSYDCLKIKSCEETEELLISFSCCAKGIKKMLQHLVKQKIKISFLEQEVKKLLCDKTKSKKLLPEKTTLQSENNVLVSKLKHSNNANTIKEECFIDDQKISSSMQEHKSSNAEEHAPSKGDETLLQNEQELKKLKPICLTKKIARLQILLKQASNSNDRSLVGTFPLSGHKIRQVEKIRKFGGKKSCETIEFLLALVAILATYHHKLGDFSLVSG